MDAPSPCSTATRKCIVVLGMHRSGTSLVAGLCRFLGADAGLETRLMEPTRFNARGFFEHWDVAAQNDALLRELGIHWSDSAPLPEGWLLDDRIARFRDECLAILERDMDSGPLWILKDPRLCRTLPAWWPVFEALGRQPVFVLLLRNPLESARSLERFQGVSPDRGLALWLRYLLDAERHTRGRPRVLVRYDDAIDDPAREAQRMAARLGIEWPIDPASAAAEIRDFVDVSLRHERVADDLLVEAPNAGPGVRSAFEALCEAAAVDDLDAVRERFDAISEELSDAGPQHPTCSWEPDEPRRAKARTVRRLGRRIVDAFRALAGPAPPPHR